MSCPPRLLLKTHRHLPGRLIHLPRSLQQLKQLAAPDAGVDTDSPLLHMFVDDGLITDATYCLVRDGDVVYAQTGTIEELTGFSPGSIRAPVSKKRPREDNDESATNQSSPFAQPQQPPPSHPAGDSKPVARIELNRTDNNHRNSADYDEPERKVSSASSPSPSPAPAPASVQTPSRLEARTASSSSRPASNSNSTNQSRDQIVIDEDGVMMPSSFSSSASTTTQSSSRTPHSSKPSSKHWCASPGCTRPAAFGPCPTCVALNLPDSQIYFCGNNCFRENWSSHSKLAHGANGSTR